MHFTHILTTAGFLSLGECLSTTGRPRTDARNAREITRRETATNLPNIGYGIYPEGTRYGKLRDALAGANDLMKAAVEDTELNRHIFATYFDPDWWDVAMEMFKRLLGNDLNGAPEMANIEVAWDQPRINQINATWDSWLDDAAPENDRDPNRPVLVIGDLVWERPNSRALQQGNESQTRCLSLQGPELYAHEAALLETVLIRQYFHWKLLMADVTGCMEVVDKEDDARPAATEHQLDKSRARYDAPSYSWYATAVFWARLCQGEVGLEQKIGVPVPQVPLDSVTS
ncbi:Uu.00g103630.m01.CDS01 [Anthostomella pinea]|uniref:Uu.00g103630.m01.CDS01 n=1 Tax=Anthostomella pinea TaxID=933095 RepID=A0AAI8YFR6_9PEZI|nr:Uu.00g103630.m01.CDS01 [Anthostomella pinea]